MEMDVLGFVTSVRTTWLLHRSGVMPSIVNIFGEREVL